MAIEIECPGCSRGGAVPETYAGHQIKCRSCGTSFTVPSPAGAIPGGGTPGDGPLDEAAPPEPVPDEPPPIDPGEVAGPPHEENDPVAAAIADIPLADEPAPVETRQDRPAPAGPATEAPPVRHDERRRAERRASSPNFGRAFLFFVFRVVLAAIVGGTLYAVFELPGLLGVASLYYVAIGVGVLITLMYLLLVRAYYRSHPGAFPEPPR